MAEVLQNPTKRLIDANAFIKECDSYIVNPPFAHPATPWHRGLTLAAETALRMPTVDAVEVVRCKDCKHRGEEIICPMCFEEPIEWDDDGYSEIDWILHDCTHNDGFCDRGERIADDGR